MPKSSHITSVLNSLHWLRINERIKYKLHSLTYKVLTTNQPQYLYNLVSVQPCHNTHSSSMVTLAHPPTQFSLKITNCYFRYAAPCLSNKLPTDLCEPRQTQSPALSPFTHGSSSSSLSLLASSLIGSVFYSELKTWLFGKSFSPQTFSLPTGLSPRTLGPSNVFILLNGWICLLDVLDKLALSRFLNAL